MSAQSVDPMPRFQHLLKQTTWILYEKVSFHPSASININLRKIVPTQCNNWKETKRKLKF